MIIMFYEAERKDFEENMDKKEAFIIKYLEETYNPSSIFVYGSYKEGLANPSSDFDCLIIVDKKDKSHDETTIRATELDCFIYEKDEIKEENLDDFYPLYSSLILKDDGFGGLLQEKVRVYLDTKSKKSRDEKVFIINRIRKSIRKIRTEGDKGAFRAISFYAESLEVYFELKDMVYQGPNQAMSYLRKRDKKGYKIFSKALKSKSKEDIIGWAEYLIELGET